MENQLEWATSTWPLHRPVRFKVHTVGMTIQVFWFMTTGMLNSQGRSRGTCRFHLQHSQIEAYWKRGARLKGRQISPTSIQCFHTWGTRTERRHSPHYAVRTHQTLLYTWYCEKNSCAQYAYKRNKLIEKETVIEYLSMSAFIVMKSSIHWNTSLWETRG
jgi:hypothetical protein